MHSTTNRARSALTRLGAGTLDLLFPALCVACQDRVPDKTPLPICLPCRRSLPAATADTLDARLDRVPGALDAFDHRLALWTFDEGGVLQRLQHALKYGDRPTLGLELGRPIGRLWKQSGLPTPGAVVPVPMTRMRFLERGYNQAERIAAGIASELDTPVQDLLTTTRARRSQTSLSARDRRTNVKGAFALKQPDLPLDGRRLLIVDDVLTTGATMLAAAEPLKAAGANVDLALLALTKE